VHVDQKNGEENSLHYDPEKVKAYSRILNEIQDLAGIEEQLSLRNILNFGDIFTVQEEDDEQKDHIWSLIQQAAGDAVKNLIKMRVQEGTQLKHDMQERIRSIEEELIEIEEKSKGRIPAAKEKLLDRVKSLMEDDNFDEDRLELEIAIMVDKMDITEELVRLRSHLKFFLEAIEEGSLMGRRLNFLTQEINRELNTIGSKANNSEIAHHVVRSKESLEQIREQVQNIE
jgi:uncharacterized protein (TIGR00255 family)